MKETLSKSKSSNARNNQAANRKSLQEIWRLGCADQRLHALDQAHFADLAKSRFHTYMLGMQHATSNAAEPGTNARQLLVNGLVSELQANPGLRQQWDRYHFAGSRFGEPVTKQLKSDHFLTRMTATIQRLFNRSP